MYKTEYLNRQQYQKAQNESRIFLPSRICYDEEEKDEIIEVICLDDGLLETKILTESNSFVCPVCYVKKTNSHLSGCACGHLICKKCMSRWKELNSSCPICRKKLS